MSSTRSSTSVPLAFLLICASLLHVSFGIVIEKGPTAPEIISHKEFRDALSKVWSESSIGNGVGLGVRRPKGSSKDLHQFCDRANLLLGPSGYPGGNEKYTNQKYHIYGPNPFPCYK